jgi:hypothetical protein
MLNKYWASKFDDDIVNLAIFYFSRLPDIETKPYGGRFVRKSCGRIYGVILLIASGLTIYEQLILIQDVNKAIISGDQVHRNRENRKDVNSEYRYILKPGVKYHNFTSPFRTPEEVAAQIAAQGKDYNEPSSEDAIKAMSISFIILSAHMGFHIYQHGKALGVAFWLPYSQVGNITIFHIICSNILGFFSLMQVFFCIQVQYMSFYLILTSKKLMDIYKNAVVLLFINQISMFVGLFFKVWIRASDHHGLEFLRARTHFRSHIEIIAKCVMLSTMGGVWYVCLKEWYRHDDIVNIYYDIQE